MTQQRDKATEKVLKDELQELDAQVTAESDKLKSVKTDVKAEKIRLAQAERRSREAKEKHERQMAEYGKREEDLKAKVAKLAAQLNTIRAEFESDRVALQEKLDSLKTELKTTNEESRERATYLKEQEAVIQNTIDDGAARIADLDYQVKELLKQQQLVLKENAENLQARDARMVEIQSLLDRMTRLQTKYEETVTRYRASLETLRSQIFTESEKLKAIKAESSAVLEKLSAKERELDTREGTIEVREREQAREHRLIESRRNMYTPPAS
jgi:chromosome segregation ATPase